MNELQWQASHPDYSIWVSASAGTGKTKILTDRVLRLLLKGADPQKVLCLTFTNAAASEMQHRIDSKLSKWASMTDHGLSADIESIIGKKPLEDTLQTARDLFNTSLKVHGKIEIHTIHSYCQKILKRFPLEANVSPGFQVVDEIKAKEILKKIKNQIYLDHSHGGIVDFFTSNFHEATINDTLDEIIKQKLKFKNYLASDNLDHKAGSKKNEGLETTNAFEEIKALCAELKKTFAANVKSEEETHKIMSLDIDDKSQIYSLFLTKEGNKRQRVISKKISDKYPEIADKCEQCQRKIYAHDQLEKIQLMVKYTGHLKEFAQVFIDHYESYKLAQGLLDYDDLIYHAKNLLNHSDYRDWVLYKLDGGIDHLLVDEAQDTSPYQWEIIEALIAEFYAGQGARGGDRTVFVVGDEKQSIFSFQGADLDSLNLISAKLRSKLLAAKKNYENINLKYSYRSVPSIIEAVSFNFKRIKQYLPNLFPAENPEILPFRENQKGSVELWPLVDNAKDLKVFWPKPEDHNNALSAQKKLAINIANFIRQTINEGEILSSTGLPVRLQDFLILVRKRDQLAREIINQLKLQQLETAGIDRMLLSENISVMDLISVAKFVLSPHGDLNLVTLLKSPIIGFDDELINQIIKRKDTRTVWETLQEGSPANDRRLVLAVDKLKLFLRLYNIYDSSNFFHIIVDSLGNRKLLTQINGADSDDAINELLYLSHNYANNIDSSLQSFVFWFETNEIEIKRSIHSADKIKIMTVHGSKGLQAPIVILCDTTSLPITKAKFYHTEKGELIACQQSKLAPQIFNDHKQAQQLKDLQEYLRLMYVGMTRPQDHLIICGYKPQDSLSPHCWYSLAENSMREIANINQNNIMKYVSESVKENDKIKGPASSSPPQLKLNIDAVVANKIKLNGAGADDMSDAAFNLLKNDEFLFGNTLPTSAVISPLYDGDLLEYGKIFHKVLEDSLKARDIQSLKSHPLIASLPSSQQNKMLDSINVLSQNKVFESLMDGEIRTEINIGVLDGEGNKAKLGRIDLLSIKNNQVTIVDYKSDAKPPTSAEAVSIDYVKQLHFYSEAVGKIFPDRKVISQILWLQNGEFMEIV